MKMRFDWKFWITLLITFASVVVPIWLWQADISSRSIHFKKISQTSLQPPDTAKALDLKMSVDNAELPAPYLTVFELINDGARPISSSDFESPIEIVSTNAAVIVRTSINEKNPLDLAPIITLDNGLIRIKPMLLNVGDSVTIAVLTTGGEPKFLSRARIAGVQSVPILDAKPKSKLPIWVGLILIITALLSLVVLNLVIGGWPFKGVHLRARSAFLIFLLADASAAICVIFGLEAFGVDGLMLTALVLGVGIFLTLPVAKWMNREVITKHSSTSE